LAVRFLLDENVPASILVFLKKKGFEARSVRDVLGAGSSNGKIAGEASHSGEIIVTLDADFLKLHPDPQAKILHVDVHPAIPTNITQALEAHLAKCIQLLRSSPKVRLAHAGPEARTKD